MQNPRPSQPSIRNEQPQDQKAIAKVLESAFAGQGEQKLVDLIRARNEIIVSQVALVEGELVGHILFTAARAETAPPNTRGVALGPVAIQPPFQQQGIGSALIRSGLQACRALGYDFAMLLGHPQYYPRFGFSPAQQYGLQSVYNAPRAFMVKELRPGGLRGVKGTLFYISAFEDAQV